MTTPPSYSLRLRLLVGLLLGLAILQVLASTAIYLLQRRALFARFDQALVTTARALAQQVKFDKPKGVHLDLEKLGLPEFQRAKGPDYFELWRSDGTVAARSVTLGDSDLPRSAPGLKPVKFDAQLPRAEPGRAVLLTWELPQKGNPDAPPETLTLVVAKESRPVRDDLRTLAGILLGTSLAALLAAGGVSLLVVNRALRPVQRLAAQVAEVGPASLARPLDPTGLPAEILPVAERLNAMLDRLDAAFSREKAFTGDVAHELRTPIAALRAIAEVALDGVESPDEYRRNLAEVLTLAQAMQEMVEKLLLLARLEGGQMPLQSSAVPLAAAVAAALESCRAAFARRSISVDIRIPESLCVQADLGLLAMVLSNVMANAAAYTEERGTFDMTAAASDSARVIQITFTNTCHQLSPEQVPHVFERFWRADAARTMAGHHAGLGLSLVQRAVIVMGGKAEARVETAGRFVLEIQLPAPAGALADHPSAGKSGNSQTTLPF